MGNIEIFKHVCICWNESFKMKLICLIIEQTCIKAAKVVVVVVVKGEVVM
jgi:hypothetical protein